MLSGMRLNQQVATVTAEQSGGAADVMVLELSSLVFHPLPDDLGVHIGRCRRQSDNQQCK